MIESEGHAMCSNKGFYMGANPPSHMIKKYDAMKTLMNTNMVAKTRPNLLSQKCHIAYPLNFFGDGLVDFSLILLNLKFLLFLQRAYALRTASWKYHEDKDSKVQMLRNH
jgi:hypothetical protein